MMSIFAYVANYGSNNVSIIDLSTNTVVETVAVGTNPIDVAITPDGNYAYVTNFNSDTISVIDTSNNSVVDTIVFDQFTRPNGIAITPDGNYAYVVNSGINNVAVIDLSTNTAVDNITVGNFPEEIAITPDGAYAYVTNAISGTTSVSVIEISSNNVVDTISFEIDGFSRTPRSIVFTPDGNFAYVAVSVAYIDSVYVIDTSSNTIIDTIRVGDNSWAITISPDGNFVYVTNTFTDNVSVINTSTNSEVNSINVGSDPEGIAITSDGNFLYVTNSNSNTVSVIETGINVVIDTINVGLDPKGIAMLNPPEPQIDLTITKSDSPDPVRLGENLSYTITVENNGPNDATNVMLIDTLPEEVDYISVSSTKGSCSETGGVVTCNLTTINNGDVVTAIITVVPNIIGDICNSAEVSASETDSNPLDNSVTECTTVFEPLTPVELIDNLIDYINGLNLIVRLILIPLLITARFLLNIGLESLAIIVLDAVIILVRVLMLIRILSEAEGKEIIDQIHKIINLL
jgi:uncharacterized repeat protein (TIGR01451 family)